MIEHAAIQSVPTCLEADMPPRNALVITIAMPDNIPKINTLSYFVESLMSAVDHSALYDDLVDLLAASADVQCGLAFRLSHEKQPRLDALLEKIAQEQLTTEEAAEFGYL
jgi:hypothetical protein